MKHIVWIAVLLLLPVWGFSQIGLDAIPRELSANKMVSWKFSLKPVEGNVYLFTATAVIEKGYHIFHLNAGGDGTLINTEITFNGATETDEEWSVTPAPRVIQLDIIEGDIYWHEKTVSFSKAVELPEGTDDVSGSVSYQVCNEEKCLPPATVDFRVTARQ